jgi:hypothetical protein
LVEERNLCFADGFQVSLQARHVQVRHAARDDDVVRDAVRLERGQFEIAHFDRVVDQLIVVGRAIGAEAIALGARFFHRGRHAPGAGSRIGRPLDVDLVRRRFLPHHAQEHAGAVEEAVGLVQVRSAHRQVPRVHLVVQRQRAGAWCCAPCVLVELCQCHGGTGPLGADAHDIAREFADHVAARDPGRQREGLPVRIGIGHRQRDVEQVTGQVPRDDGVENCALFFL